MWVRGLKLSTKQRRYDLTTKVAPHVGAWIETSLYCCLILDSIESHPMWVRGLKQRSIRRLNIYIASHPMWVRGLKQMLRNDKNSVFIVAPHVGAWIET